LQGPDAIAFLKSLGCRIDDRPKINGTAANAGKRKIIETYDYIYLDGTITSQAVRLGFIKPDGTWRLNGNSKPDKIFSQRRRYPGSKLEIWIWGASAGEYMCKAPGEHWYKFNETGWAKLPPTRERETFNAAKIIPYRALKGRVLILSAEDDIEDTIIPRLVAAGADLNRVEIVRMVRLADGKGRRMFSLVSDLELLRRKLTELDDVVIVIIDPMSAYLGVGRVDSYRTTDVRGVLAPLTELAAEKQCFLLGVLHFNKKSDVSNAVLRISDSLAFAATARHCYVVVDDAEDEKQRLFVKAKNNLAPDTKALSFAVNALVVGQDKQTGNDIWAPRIVWGLEHVEITATQAMEAVAAGTSRAAAKGGAEAFLREILEGGPVAKRDIEEAAEANCISRRTLFRCKADLGVIARKAGMKAGWTWQLPDTPSNKNAVGQ